MSQPAHKPNEAPIQHIELRNRNGISIKLTNFGGTVTAIDGVPDTNNERADVALGFRTPLEYRTKSHPYMGSTVGRYANRIANGEFEQDGKTYKLAVNNGPNHLHGGIVGFDKNVWEITDRTNNSVTFYRISRKGEEGYPGAVQEHVTFTLTNDNEVRIDYTAVSDEKTPINITNHSYFNLQGEGSKTVAAHVVRINASRYTPVNGVQIPLGIASVENTPFDLRKGAPIGDALDQIEENEQLKIGQGYDHYFIADRPPGTNELIEVAHVVDPVSMRSLTVETTEPGLQFFTGSCLDGSITGKSGKTYGKYSGLCLETGGAPDGPNQPNLPSVTLQAGETYFSTTVFRLGVEQSRAARR